QHRPDRSVDLDHQPVRLALRRDHSSAGARRLLRTGGSSTMDPAPPSSIPPKVLEPVGRQFGVPDRVLDVLVSKVVLQGPPLSCPGAGLFITLMRTLFVSPESTSCP